MTEQSPDVRANKTRLLDDVFDRITAAIAADRTRVGQADGRRRGPRADRSRPVHAAAGAGGRAGRRRRRSGTAGDGDRARAGPARRRHHRSRDRADRAGRLAGPPRRASSWSTARSSTARARSCRSASAASPGPTRCSRRWRSAAPIRRVGAVVLRVNSPGGSAFASDVIARAIVQLRAAGKPVVVSMGDLAASGGYYIAAPADVVFAEPSTITGSIGIFAIKVDAAQAAWTLLGINVETDRRGAHADYLSPYRPWTEAELKLVMDKMRYLYGQFIETVANGRAVARADRRARRRARARAGVDRRAGAVGRPGRRLGGLADAIDEAARRRRHPVGRDQMPEIHVLPRAPLDLVRRLVARRRRAIGRARASEREAGHARAAADARRCAPRCGMLAPTLLARRHRLPGPAALRHRLALTRRRRASCRLAGRTQHRGVAQPGSASALGAECRRFKSFRPDRKDDQRGRSTVQRPAGPSAPAAARE